MGFKWERNQVNTSRCRIVLSSLFITLVFLVACQQNIPEENTYNPDIDIDTTASTEDKADLGNRVWLDANGDGIKQRLENGFSDVRVVLWTDRDGDGSTEGEDRAGTQTTDAGGFYRFNAIRP